MGELAFAEDPALVAQEKAAVLVGSLTAAVVACVLLKWRDNVYKRLTEAENLDEDLSGVPDIYERDDPEYHRRMIAIYEAKLAEHRKWLETHPGGHKHGDTRHDV